MKKAIWAAAVASVLCVPVALAPASGQSQRTSLDAYCSPSGDVCLAVNLIKGNIKLQLQTPSFTGDYTLCVKGPADKQCRDFELGEADGVYFDRVDWARKFRDQGNGRYKVVWKLGDSKIGEALHFELASPDARQGDVDCSDFSSQAAAQDAYENSGPGDPNGLDADSDGVACETNPCPCSTGGGGGGGTPAPAPPPPPAPDPIKTDRVCGNFVGISGSRVCLKIVTQDEKLKRVEDFRFRGLPAQCGDGNKPKLTGKDQKIDGEGKKFRSRRVTVLGGFSSTNAKAVGELKDGGKVTGDVRVRARNNAGAPCDTRARKYKVG